MVDSVIAVMNQAVLNAREFWERFLELRIVTAFSSPATKMIARSVRKDVPFVKPQSWTID